MSKNNKITFNPLLEPSLFKENGESSIIKGKYGFVKESFKIDTTRQSQQFHKPKGNYTLLTFKNILNCNDDEYTYYSNKLISSIKEYLTPIKQDDTILIVGLGNRHIASDSLGIEVIKNINITRHFNQNQPQICAFSPSVLGLTGIETADTIDGISGKIKPNIIIMIDSLCASDISRLGVSFQISNTPIIPGSGINNTRKKVSSKIKTISIGVPLVTYASTFIKSAINKANIDINHIPDKELKNKINSLLSQEFDGLVTLGEIDYSVKHIGKLIANAINNTLIK